MIAASCAFELQDDERKQEPSPEQNVHEPEGFAGGDDLQSTFTKADGYLVSGVIEAPEKADRVTALIAAKEGQGEATSFSLEARGRRPDGGFGPWVAVEITHGEGDLQSGYVDLGFEADAAQIRIPESQAAAVASLSWTAPNIARFSEATASEETEVGTQTQALSADLSAIGVKPRSSWTSAGSPCTGESRKYRFAVHHTASAAMTGPGAMRTLREWHLARGFCDVGYHFVVDKTGTVYEGRPLQYLGAHVSSQNTGNIGVSLLGCYESGECDSVNRSSGSPKTPPAAMLEAAGRVIGQLGKHFGIAMDRSHVKGHGEWNPSACPGNEVSSRFSTIMAATSSKPPAPPPAAPIVPVYSVVAGDFNGDGKKDIATLSPNAHGSWNSWAALELSTGSAFTSTTWSAATPQHMRNGGADRSYRTVVGDFDGNGKDDLATFSPNGGGGWAGFVAMELSTGSGFASTTWSAGLPGHMRNGGAANTYWSVTGDFNGDGKTDVATLSPNGGGAWAANIEVELSTGASFRSGFWAASTPGHIRNGGGAARRFAVVTGDFNGDGKTDIATVSQNGGGGWADWVALELSTGSGFESVVWAAATPGHMRNGDSSKRYFVFAGDFNGDGKSDLLTISPDGGGGWASWAALELSTGTGFTSTRWTSPTPQHMRNGGAARSYRTFAEDFNGDGKADLATLSTDGGGGWAQWLSMDLSTGAGFASTRWTSPTPQHIRNGGSSNDFRVLAGDFDDDGRADLAILSPNAAGAWSSWITLDRSTGGGLSFSAPRAATPGHMRNGAK